MSDLNLVKDAYLENVVDNNENINRGLVENQRNLELELSQLGVNTKPAYNIEPALGLVRYNLYFKED